MSTFLDRFKQACESARAIASNRKEQAIVCSFYSLAERTCEAVPISELADYLIAYKNKGIAIHYITPPTL